MKKGKFKDKLQEFQEIIVNFKDNNLKFNKNHKNAKILKRMKNDCSWDYIFYPRFYRILIFIIILRFLHTFLI